jgi:uncharacterized repeat protein (TIGR01451 family)
MKHPTIQKEKSIIHPMAWAIGLAAALLILGGLRPLPVFAVANTGVGYLGASDANMGDGTINLTIQTMSVVKRAFTPTGTAIADGSTVAVGTQVKFMMYINNKSDTPLNDVSIRDVLAANFVYQAGTIKVINPAGACALAACTAAEETTMFTAADAAAALTDAVDADTASFAAATVDVGNQLAANGQRDIVAQSRLVVLITVLVQ